MRSTQPSELLSVCDETTRRRAVTSELLRARLRNQPSRWLGIDSRNGQAFARQLLDLDAVDEELAADLFGAE